VQAHVAEINDPHDDTDNGRKATGNLKPDVVLEIQDAERDADNETV
jgi:hypothetical protein